METNTLHFSWAGDLDGVKGMKDPVLCLYFNGKVVVSDWDYTDGFSIDIPITGNTMEIEVKIGERGKEKRKSCLKHTFDRVPGASYWAELEGKVSSFMGLKLKLSRPDETLDDSTPVCHPDTPIAMLSFCFPIYGIINAIRSKYNRKAAVIGAAVGFLLAMIFSASVPRGYETGIGFGRTMLIEYEPFSLLDWIFNLLVGGIASFRGLIYLILEGLF